MMHHALVSLYSSVAVLAFSSLFGTLLNLWSSTPVYVSEIMMFVAVCIISFAAIQLIRESRLLITMIRDDNEQQSAD
jgi:hypothetical protein